MGHVEIVLYCALCGDSTVPTNYGTHKLHETICPTCRDKLRQAAGITLNGNGIDYAEHTRGLWKGDQA